MFKNPAVEDASQLGSFKRRYRANLEESLPLAIVFAGLAALMAFGNYWIIQRPVPWDIARIGSVLLLAGLAIACLYGARVYWRASHRAVSLHDNGISYFDGATARAIPWPSIAEIYEVMSGMNLLGFSVGKSRPEVTIVTDQGVRVRIDKTISGGDLLAPIIASAVNNLLWQDAESRLRNREPMKFGCLSLSETGIVIEKPTSRSIVPAIQYELETDMDDFEARPGNYPWEEIHDIRIESASSSTATYRQVAIYANGHKFPVFLCGIPEFPNFWLFTETMQQLGRPLKGAPG